MSFAAIQKALVGKLRSSAELMAKATGVYSLGAVPRDGAVPYLLVSLDGGTDEYTLGQRVRTACTFQVQVVDVGPSQARAYELAELVDQILTRAELSLESGEFWIIERRDVRAYPELREDGKVYQYVISDFRVEVG